MILKIIGVDKTLIYPITNERSITIKQPRPRSVSLPESKVKTVTFGERVWGKDAHTVAIAYPLCGTKIYLMSDDGKTIDDLTPEFEK